MFIVTNRSRESPVGAACAGEGSMPLLTKLDIFCCSLTINMPPRWGRSKRQWRSSLAALAPRARGDSGFACERS